MRLEYRPTLIKLLSVRKDSKLLKQNFELLIDNIPKSFLNVLSQNSTDPTKSPLVVIAEKIFDTLNIGQILDDILERRGARLIVNTLSVQPLKLTPSSMTGP